MNDGYLSAKHAAEYLDLSYDAFDQAVRRHALPCYRIGRLRRFLKSDLQAALQAMALRPRKRQRRAA